MSVRRLVIALLVLATLCAGVALAARAPTPSERRAIAAAVAGGPDGSFYCAGKGGRVQVSTISPRWAVAKMRSNCGLGSQGARFFVRRASAQATRWRLVERHYESLGSGKGVPCGSRRVPKDIRCGG